MNRELVKRFLAFGAVVFSPFIAYCVLMRFVVIRNMYADMVVSFLLLIVTFYIMFRLIVWMDKKLDKK